MTRCCRAEIAHARVRRNEMSDSGHGYDVVDEATLSSLYDALDLVETRLMNFQRTESLPSRATDLTRAIDLTIELRRTVTVAVGPPSS